MNLPGAMERALLVENVVRSCLRVFEPLGAAWRGLVEVSSFEAEAYYGDSSERPWARAGLTLSRDHVYATSAAGILINTATSHCMGGLPALGVFSVCSNIMGLITVVFIEYLYNRGLSPNLGTLSLQLFFCASQLYIILQNMGAAA